MRAMEKKMPAREDHRPLIIDGLLICDWSSGIFREMQEGGLTAAICTCSVWESFRKTCENIAVWKRWLAENSEHILQVYSADDIVRAHTENRTGIILGWQNTSALEGNVDFVQFFADLGVRCVQLTYNAQNLVGTGCWERVDGGLTSFGHDIVAALNKSRILIDLSHVGSKTAHDAIETSSSGVAYTHVCPRGLKDYARNKTDEELRHIVSKAGFVGIAFWPPFMKDDWPIEIDSYIRTLEYTINIVGEENVGIGSDLTQGHPSEWIDWLHSANGTGSRMVPKLARRAMSREFCRVSHYQNLIPGMERAGWKANRIERILGKNWLNFLHATWGN
jgi:membrane dipeptidase